MSEVGFGNDGDFSEERFIQKVNTNLANELGNLCQRILSLVFKNCNKAVPLEIGPYTAEDEAILAKARSLLTEAEKVISVQALQKYADLLIAMVWEANKYCEVTEPWVLKKTDPVRMATVLYVLMETLRYIAILYQPIIPSGASNILDQLTVSKDARSFDKLEESIQFGTPVSKPVPVFPRVDVPENLVD